VTDVPSGLSLIHPPHPKQQNKSQEDWFRHSEIGAGRDTQTLSQQGKLIIVHNKIEHRNIVAYGGFKKSISGYTRNRMQNPTIKFVN
jgi:hypothetical protein